MNDTITALIAREANERDIIPISARETGSREMCVSHDDSDWDVRLLYARPTSWYATHDAMNDTTDFEDGEIDVHGWNVVKFGAMLGESNPSAIEYLLSSTDYLPDRTGFLDTLELAAVEDANRMALYHHYLSLAKSNYKQYIANGNDRTKGRAFYVTRALLYAQYIRETNKLPPINVWNFLKKDGATRTVDRGFLRNLASSKIQGYGSEELPESSFHRVKDIYETETGEAEDLEATDERTRQVPRGLIDTFIDASIPR